MTPGAARPFNNWDAIKVLAVLLMFVDHSGAFIYPEDTWLRAIGRGAAPIFLFLGGYASSYRFNRELFWLGVAMTVSDTLLAGHLRPQNILFSILLCRMLFAWLEKHGKKITRPYEWYVGALVFVPISIFVVQYGSMGLIFAIGGYLKRHRDFYSPRLQRNFLLLAFITHGIIEAWLL